MWAEHTGEMTGGQLETETAPGEKVRAEASEEIQEPIIWSCVLISEGH